MCMLWTKQLSIGNTIVDSEHKHLISLTNYVERSMMTAMDTKDGSDLQQAFDQLEYALSSHFRNEEKIARALNLPFEQHRKTQLHMLSDIHFLKTELMTKDCIWTEAALRHFSEFLEDLIMEHITQADMPMKSALQGYDYNFWPEQNTAATGDAEPLWLNPVAPAPLAMHAAA
ncbi:MAG: hemerythrin family protein [Gallionella sp.]